MRSNGAYLEDELAKKLVLQAGLCDREVHQSHFGAQLRRIVWTRQPGRAVQLEAFCYLHLESNELDMKSFIVRSVLAGRSSSA